MALYTLRAACSQHFLMQFELKLSGKLAPTCCLSDLRFTVGSLLYAVLGGATCIHFTAVAFVLFKTEWPQ